MKTQILNCKTIADLKDLNLDNATSLEKSIVRTVVDNFDDADIENEGIANLEIAVRRFSSDHDYEAVPESVGTNCAVEGVFEVGDWWDAQWDEFFVKAADFKEDREDVDDVEVMEFEDFEKRYTYNYDSEEGYVSFNNVARIITNCGMKGFIDNNISCGETLWHVAKVPWNVQVSNLSKCQRSVQL